MPNQLPVTVLLKKADGKLVFANNLEETKFNIFLKTLDENESVSVTYEVSSDTGTYPQLSKIHKCIRELASYTGNTFEEMKVQVKIRSGLCFDGTCRSFGDCSKEELSLVIQSIIEIGDLVGFNLH